MMKISTQVKRPLIVPDDINEAVECDTGFTKQDIGDFEVLPCIPNAVTSWLKKFTKQQQGGCCIRVGREAERQK